jgi:exodeoxyribonuclease VII small subunit
MTEPAVGLEQRIARIEEIASALESDRLELDQALRLFEEGVRHLRAAESLLREGELRIERLLEQDDGSVATHVVEEPEA